MGVYTPTEKQRAIELLDRLDAGQFAAIVHLLQVMTGSIEDRDILSGAERQAVAEADEWLKHNQPIPHEQVLADLGLTVDDWERMSEEALPEEIEKVNG